MEMDVILSVLTFLCILTTAYIGVSTLKEIKNERKENRINKKKDKLEEILNIIQEDLIFLKKYYEEFIITSDNNSNLDRIRLIINYNKNHITKILILKNKIKKIEYYFNREKDKTDSREILSIMCSNDFFKLQYSNEYLLESLNERRDLFKQYENNFNIREIERYEELEKIVNDEFNEIIDKYRKIL